jgi:hypothetical protein
MRCPHCNQPINPAAIMANKRWEKYDKKEHANKMLDARRKKKKVKQILKYGESEPEFNLN